MADVYSTRFIAGTAGAGAGAAPKADLNYTVPAGYRAVVRSITTSPSGSGNASPSITIQGLSYLYRRSDLVAGSSDHVECNQVVNGGEVISCFCELGSAFFTVSGFLLLEISSA